LLEITENSSQDIESVRELFAEYWVWLEFEPNFQGFNDEIENLPGRYGPPDGCLLVARYNGTLAGCVALRKLDDAVCEMKRLYVRPGFRDKGIGATLTTRIIEAARERGYRRMRLDTLPVMNRAIALYRTLGFHDIAPYGDDRAPGAHYMELEL
jgi:ribosomal protein S18 acetylase RimI-like enzyme